MSTVRSPMGARSGFGEFTEKANGQLPVQEGPAASALGLDVKFVVASKDSQKRERSILIFSRRVFHTERGRLGSLRKGGTGFSRTCSELEKAVLNLSHRSRINSCTVLVLYLQCMPGVAETSGMSGNMSGNDEHGWESVSLR